METALRAGHGLGVSLGVAVRSGPEPAISLEVRGPSSVRWVERVLAGAYDPGQWRRTPVDPVPDGGETLFARRRGLPGERPVPPPESGAVVLTAALALSAIRSGTELDCLVSPVVDRYRLPDLERYLEPAGIPRPAPVGGRAAPFRVPPPTPVASDPGPLWTATVRVRVPRAAPAEERRRAIGAAEAAWRRIDGIGISFSRALAYLRIEPRFLLTSAELIAVLPPREVGGSGAGLGAIGSGGLPLGRTPAGTVVRVPVEPAQGRHLAILGETGMGKSSLIVGLAVRAARQGGLVLLDPLGETAREVRSELAGAGVPVLSISPGEDAPSINALEGIGGGTAIDPVRAERRIADIVHALRRVRSGRYADSFWGPRLEEMLTRAVRSAAAFPGGTLADAHTLLSTSGLTRRAAPPGAEESLRELAARIRERPEDADGARRLLHEVVRNPTLARMLCARTPELSAAEFVRPGRIVLVSGDAARVGEATARYLLAVYLALVWSELLASGPGSKTFVFLDEAQWFAHESLAEMLRLARRRNVHVVLATQSIASLPENVREAAWTNVADFVAFRGLPEEARELARAAPGVPAERLLALPRGEAAVLIGKGQSVRWVRTARIPRPVPPPTTAAGGRGEDPAAGRPADSPFRAATPPPEMAIAWLRERSWSVEAGRLLRLPLAELRARYPTDPEVVRRVGARLGRLGAIRRTERTEAGAVWWLDPEPLRKIPADGSAPSPDDSSRPQPS
ncbi:MAG: ATP-binding protein [Thermoplasmata archaeon]